MWAFQFPGGVNSISSAITEFFSKGFLFYYRKCFIRFLKRLNHLSADTVSWRHLSAHTVYTCQLGRAGFGVILIARVITGTQVHDSPYVTPENFDALSFTMQRLAQDCKSMPAQIVSACIDPDPRIASVAIACAKRLVYSAATWQSMLEADVADRIVCALSHTSLYCRTAACLFTSLAKDSTELLEKMLAAEVVPALIAVLGEGPYPKPEEDDEDKDGDCVPAESKLLFGKHADLLVAQPALCASVVLVLLMELKGSVAHKVVLGSFSTLVL